MFKGLAAFDSPNFGFFVEHFRDVYGRFHGIKIQENGFPSIRLPVFPSLMTTDNCACAHENHPFAKVLKRLPAVASRGRIYEVGMESARPAWPSTAPNIEPALL